MRAIRRPVSLALLGSLFVIPASLPAVAQSGPPAKVTHRQSVQTELSPVGDVGVSRVYTQVMAEGEGTVDVALPGQATGSLRNLEDFGSPTVDGDTVTYSIDAQPDGVAARTVADNTADQPVDISVVYELDGEEVKPRAVVGATGTLTATYTVQNLTSVPEEITYFNGQGQAQQETLDVSVPMVGSLSTTLDGRFSDVTAPGAAVAGDGRGNTVVNASLLLFAPLGSETAVASWSAQVDDAVVPSAKIQILPVNSRSFGSIRSTQDSYKGVSDGLTDLTNGALIVDGNAKLLADGAAQLFDGLQQLEDGAGELGAGLSETAAPGARTLSDGLGTAREGGDKLANGLGDLATGAGTLSAGLTTAREGGDKLANGLGDLSTGAGTLSDGLGTARAGSGDLASGLSDLSAGAGSLSSGVTGVRGGIGGPGDSADDGTVIGGVNAIRDGLSGIPATVQVGLEQNLEAALNGIVRPQLAENLEAGLETNVAGGLQSQVRPPLVAGIEDGIRTNLGAVLQGQVRPTLVGLLKAGVADGIAANLEPAIVDAMSGPLSGALQQTFAIPEEQADPFAESFSAMFAAGFAPGFANQFAEGFAAEVDPQIEEAFSTVATDFGAGFAEGFDPELEAAFDAFAAGFAPQFAAGFAAQVEPSFEQFATQFSAEFAAGLDAGLQDDALPGVDRLLAGLNNPGCDVSNPTDPANPCGLRQVTGLLDAGASRLAAGSNTAHDGARALSGGLVQLDDGAGQLADGSITARDGARALQGGLMQLDDGAGQLADGSNTAREGAQALADGLVQLDDGAERLAGGLQDAADGSVQLAEGAEAAAEGGEKVADGTVALSEQGIGAIITGATDAAGEPDLLYEHLRAADRRGRSPDALPYGTTDRANASAVFAYELAGLGVDEGPSMPVQGALAMIGLALMGGLGMFVRRRVV